MKKIKLQTLLLLCIVLLATFLRCNNLLTVPPSPSVDEASTAYNAYSILKIGRGEHGSLFPLILQSFDDWQPAIYAYLTVPFIGLFGLSVLAVRLPAVLLSIVSIYLTYELVKRLFQGVAKEEYQSLHVWYGLAAAFLLAISPWHIYLSRLGYPANAGLSFFLLSMYFLSGRRFIYAMIFFVLSAMSYHTEKVFLPVFLVGFLVIYKEQLWEQRKKTLLILAIGALLLLPFILQSFQPGALARLNATSVFKIKEEDMAKDIRMNLAVARSQSFINKVMYDDRVLQLQYAFRGYLAHFGPGWLYTNIAPAQHKAPNVGLLYPWEVITVVTGFVMFFFEKIDKKKKSLVMLWFLAAPLASALSTSAPHAVRAILMLPLWQLFSGFGLVTIFIFLKKRLSLYIPIILYAVVMVVSLVLFYNQYFSVFPQSQSASFQYAISQAMPFVLGKESGYDKVIISNEGPLYQSYMYYLFYSKYDPQKNYAAGGTGSGGFAASHTFGKFEFRKIDWSKEDKSKSFLYIGSVDEIKDTNGELREFSDLDGTPEIRVVQTPL